MPILVRPVREQLEHDRIIRLLEAKWRRKFKVEANPGDERNAGVKAAAGTVSGFAAGPVAAGDGLFEWDDPA